MSTLLHPGRSVRAVDDSPRCSPGDGALGAIRDTSEEGFRQMARRPSSLARSPASSFSAPALGRHRELVHGRDRREDPRGLVEAMVSIAVYAGRAGPPCCS
ncbi:hypothetical protein GS421_13360 [Rhodococcus hoagii]|nr:hypothetical protein [Prescottella equi]